MNTKVLTTNIIFKDVIFSFDERYKVCEQIASLKQQLNQKENELTKFDDEIDDLLIDIKKYDLFFQTYNIIFHDNYSNTDFIYNIKNIELKKDPYRYPAAFYEITFDVFDLNNQQKLLRNHKEPMKQFMKKFNEQKYSIALKDNKYIQNEKVSKL